MCWLYILLVSLGVQGFVQHDNCAQFITNTGRKVIKECSKSFKIVQLRTYECYPANSQGGCGVGERLVVNGNSDCKSTVCIDNKDEDGESCLDGQVAYKGKCELIGSKSACEGEGKGKRLYADLYGTVSCKCSLDLGYVDVKGICYHQHFRGNCPNRHSLRGPTKTSPLSKCVPNSCRKGRVMWSDGKCYEYKTPPEDCDGMYVLVPKNESESETVTVEDGENVEDLLILACVEEYENRSGTFENCAAKSTKGICLARKGLPTVPKQDFKKLLCNLLPDEC